MLIIVNTILDWCVPNLEHSFPLTFQRKEFVRCSSILAVVVNVYIVLCHFICK